MAAARVLIVDEPAPRLEFYRSVIGDLATVTPLASADDLTAALQEDCALILIELTAAGRAAARRIREQPRLRSTPLLFVGGADAAAASAGVAGPVDHLPAPLVPEVLRAKVQLFVALQQAAARGAQLNEQFLATMLHELRTPLNAILGWTTLLRTGRVDPPTAERALEIIERNARAQTHLIEEMLDVARIVAGNVQLELNDVDPRAVVEAALASAMPAADARRITFNTDLPAEPLTVRADYARLQQVVGQLLSNAIRFTPEGGQVTLRLEGGADGIRIRVMDSGPGIAPDLLPNLFDRFHQEEGGAGRRRSGRGLGLTIVRRLLELHGATVAVDPPVAGQGAIFTVRLARSVTPPAARS